ncbi:hypothetical protein [Streptomyces sp. NPDC050485]|uniref:hypothetical protein n=1 Tax=Streptomyces sp. NPDC050485 TaxID=3365617 RepID=UPI0037B5CC1D
MASTPRLDSLTANGTSPALNRIHLADGQGIAVRTRPGAHTVPEVFVSPGVTVPNTGLWGHRHSRLDGWLTPGRLREGSCYVDVPVEAVRALIIQHGGEHTDQGSEWTVPGAGDMTEAQEDVLDEIADLYGRFRDGYTAEGVQAVFSRIHDAGGPYLVCVWEYSDALGFGGNSQFYAEDDNGEFFEVQPDIHRWLSGQQAALGPVDTWVAAPVAEPIRYADSDDFHNYALVDRTDV